MMIARNACLSLLLASTFASALDEQQNENLLLSLQYHRDGEVVKTINVYGTSINPGVIVSSPNQFKLTVDGVEIDNVPDTTYQRLNNLRRSFSYDASSGGIQALEPASARCRLGGPALGVTLSTRYLTYQDHKIVHDEMRTVYDQPLNCLYQHRYQPVSQQASEAARGALETLRTIDELSQHNRRQQAIKPL